MFLKDLERTKKYGQERTRTSKRKNKKRNIIFIKKPRQKQTKGNKRRNRGRK